MATWEDIAPITLTVSGLASATLRDQTGVFDENLLTVERREASKRLLAREIIARRRLSPLVRRYGSRRAFLDAVADVSADEDADLFDPVHEALAHAFLHLVSRDERMEEGDRLDQDAAYHMAELQQAVTALEAEIPLALDLPTEPATYQRFTGSICARTRWDGCPDASGNL